jgi:Dolichyl-phosphate-mannose-protein mannosyltransferase
MDSLASEPLSQVGMSGDGTVISVSPPAVATAGVGQTWARSEDGDLPRLFLVLVAAVTVGGLLLRLSLLGNSFYGDELSTYYIVNGHSLGRVLQLVHSNQETSPPLYFMVAWAVKGLLGSEVESIRLVSLVTGTAAIPLTFLLGLWTVGRRAALVGATCVALAPPMIFFSTEARPFMLTLFLALLSTLSLLRALDTGRLGWWVAYAASSCAAAYTHYTVVFLLVVQLAWALWTQPRARKYLVLANVAAAVAYLPWLGGLREDLRAPNNYNGGLFRGRVGGYSFPVTFHELRLILENWWIGHPVIPIEQLPGNLALVLAGAGLALGVVGLVLRLRTDARSSWAPSSRTVLIIMLAVGPVVLIALYSWTRADILDSRYLITSWPGLALAIAALVSSPAKPLRLVAVALTLGAFAIGAAKLLEPVNQRPDFTAAVAFIDRVGTTGDPIVDTPYFANPVSELDVALGESGSPTYTPGNTEDHAHPATSAEPHPVIRLLAPPLAQQFSHLASPHPQPIFYGLPVTPPQDVARQATALARHGTVFLVTWTNAINFLTYLPNNPIGVFLKALPRGFRLVRQVNFPGNAGNLPVSVYVFRDTASGP